MAEEEEIVCLICFCPVEKQNAHKCTDQRCLGFSCSECLARFIDIAHRNGGQKLSCPRTDCQGEYDIRSVSGLSADVMKKYQENIFLYFTKAKKGDLEERQKHDQIIQLMREERTKFYTSNMPKAILKVATIAFADRLRRVKKGEAKDKAMKYGRLCINIFCNGFLDKEMTCSKCQVKFCKDCEEQWSAEHMCKDDAKASVAFVQQMRACPECGTRIEKGEGCMAMTCAVCNTNFWYNTGEKGNAGNHGKSVPVSVKTSMPLSQEYAEFLPSILIKKLVDMEAKLGSTASVSDESLVKMASKMNPKSLDVSDLITFVKSYCKAQRWKLEAMLTGKKLAQIEKLLKEKKEGFLVTLASFFFDFTRRVRVQDVEKNTVFIASDVHEVVKSFSLSLFDALEALESGEAVDRFKLCFC